MVYENLAGEDVGQLMLMPTKEHSQVQLQYDRHHAERPRSAGCTRDHYQSVRDNRDVGAWGSLVARLTIFVSPAQQSDDDMISQYVASALERAQYRSIDNGTFAATVRGLKGVVATGATLEACRRELTEVVEEWVWFGWHAACPFLPWGSSSSKFAARAPRYRPRLVEAGARSGGRASARVGIGVVDAHPSLMPCGFGLMTIPASYRQLETAPQSAEVDSRSRSIRVSLVLDDYTARDRPCARGSSSDQAASSRRRSWPS